MGRSIRVDRLDMYKFYFLGMRTDHETSLSIVGHKTPRLGTFLYLLIKEQAIEMWHDALAIVYAR
jgi:hypothetical protein